MLIVNGQAMFCQGLLLESGDWTVDETRGIPVITSAGILLLDSCVFRTQIRLAIESLFVESPDDPLRAEALGFVYGCGFQVRE